MINSQALQIIKDTFAKASSMLKLPPMQFKFQTEPIGNRFVSVENSMEVCIDEQTIYINEDWANQMLTTDKFDLYFLTAHEVRHIYQTYQITCLQSKTQTGESLSLINQWMDNMKNYHRNEGTNTFAEYICQPIEVDANAFANFFVLYMNIGQARMSDGV